MGKVTINYFLSSQARIQCMHFKPDFNRFRGK